MNPLSFPAKLTPENNHLTLPKFPNFCTGLINRLGDRFWEKRLGIDTQGRRQIAYRDAHRYESVPYHVCFKIFDWLEAGPADVIVDVGSGKGRVLCTAALRPIRKAIGIEIDPELHAIAEANVRQIRLRRAPIHLFCQSATEYDFEGVTIVCFFNPFGGETMRRVLANLQKSIEADPREVRIVYLNATCAHLLIDQPWIELEEQWKMTTWSRVKSPVHFYRTKPMALKSRA